MSTQTSVRDLSTKGLLGRINEAQKSEKSGLDISAIEAPKLQSHDGEPLEVEDLANDLEIADNASGAASITHEESKTI